jgi:hypothetical protein
VFRAKKIFAASIIEPYIILLENKLYYLRNKRLEIVYRTRIRL